jgi:hypothetical protein
MHVLTPVLDARPAHRSRGGPESRRRSARSGVADPVLANLSAVAQNGHRLGPVSDVLNEIYLPFSEEQLREHFAPVGTDKTSADRHWTTTARVCERTGPESRIRLRAPRRSRLRRKGAPCRCRSMSASGSSPR